MLISWTPWSWPLSYHRCTHGSLMRDEESRAWCTHPNIISGSHWALLAFSVTMFLCESIRTPVIQSGVLPCPLWLLISLERMITPKDIMVRTSRWSRTWRALYTPEWISAPSFVHFLWNLVASSPSLGFHRSFLCIQGPFPGGKGESQGPTSHQAVRIP